MNDERLERRRFLETLMTTTATAGLAGCQTAKGAPPPAPTPLPTTAPPPDEWARVRSEFDLTREWLHFAGFLLASHPTPVREAIEAHRQGLDDNPALYLEGRMLDHSPVLKPAAKYMGVEPDEIALTDSTTMGLAILYSGFALNADDDVLTTTHDHYSTHESLRLACLRSGATLRKVPLYQTGATASTEGMSRAIEKALTPKTKVVAITWVHSSTGVKTPVSQIAQVIAKANQGRAADRQIILCVDGVHGFGVEDVTMQELGCDFFVAGTHKWLFGPRGTGLIWGKRDRWPLLRPTIPHFGAAAFRAWLEDVAAPATTADMMTPGGFHSFEHRWAVGTAFEFHQAIGKDRVQARIHALNRQCKEGLAKMKHVTLHTPLTDEVSAGIIAFEVAGLEPKAVLERLHQKRIVASTSPYRVSYARLSPSLLNDPEQVEQALRAVRELS